MLFYVSLFVVSVVAAGLSVWLFRALSSASRAVYRTILPSAKESPTNGGLARAHLSRRAGSEPPVPWGWGKKPSRKPASMEQYSAVASGGSSQPQVGWPYRDEPFQLPGSRTLRDAQPGSKVVSARKVPMGGVEKPWGW